MKARLTEQQRTSLSVGKGTHVEVTAAPYIDHKVRAGVGEPGITCAAGCEGRGRGRRGGEAMVGTEGECQEGEKTR